MYLNSFLHLSCVMKLYIAMTTFYCVYDLCVHIPTHTRQKKNEWHKIMKTCHKQAQHLVFNLIWTRSFVRFFLCCCFVFQVPATMPFHHFKQDFWWHVLDLMLHTFNIALGWGCFCVSDCVWHITFWCTFDMYSAFLTKMDKKFEIKVWYLINFP